MVDMMRRGKKVPQEGEREYLILAAHMLGHHGEKAVLRKIESENFWWPYMMRDIREVLDGCNLCLNISSSWLYTRVTTRRSLTGRRGAHA
jgi:hypothetical protein